MAWYTEYTTKLWFNRKTYNDLSAVLDDLEETIYRKMFVRDVNNYETVY